MGASSLLLPGLGGEAPLRSARAPRPAQPPSIAVLPFENLSPEPADAYFAAGFAEDIVASLSNIPDLLVVSRGSTLAFRGATPDPALVGGKLGVRYLLRGSIRRADRHIRLSVELVDVAEAAVLWADRHDAALEEVFALQDEVTFRVVASIATHVRRAEVSRALRQPPECLNAYDYFLRGIDLLYRLDRESFNQARVMLERAREADPGYAAAYGYAAHWHLFNLAEGWSAFTERDAAEVVRLARGASERDPTNGFALAIEGHGRSMFYRDYEAGAALFDRAVAASPNNPWVWVFGSGTCGFIGDAPTGIARAERAIRLSHSISRPSSTTACWRRTTT